jgi:hypothetical protein
MPKIQVQEGDYFVYPSKNILTPVHTFKKMLMFNTFNTEDWHEGKM